MKKIKTIKAVNAYKVLKSLKVKDLNEELCLNIWKNMKALRPINETYEKDVKDIADSLKSDEDEKWEERKQKAGELELKVKNGVIKYTMDDIDELVAIGKHNNELEKKHIPRLTELNDAEVEVDIKPIKEADFIKAIKLNDQSIGVMDELDFLIEE